MAETSPVGSPRWWLKKLDAELRRRQRDRLKRWDNYFAGRFQLGYVTEKYREAFGALLKAVSDNWMPLVVESVEERLNVQGFRFGDTEAGDTEAWYIWQANNLDWEGRLAHREALILGASYALVDPTVPVGTTPGGLTVPQVTIESPWQVIVATDPANRRVRRAALKRWRDDDGRDLATVYLPDWVYKYQRGRGGWEPRAGGDAVVRNPLGAVPVVPYANRDRLLEDGRAEFDVVIPLQDLINKTVCDMAVASEFAAYPQRWAIGVELPKDEQGNEIFSWKAAINRVWFAEGGDRDDVEPKFGQFDAADLKNYVETLATLVQHLAAQSRTPPHYMLGSIVNASGDALKAAEATLVKKVGFRQRSFEDGHEEVVRLCFAAGGDKKRAVAVDAQTLWADAETRTETERVDSCVKLLALGVPVEALWLRAGFSPTEAGRFKRMIEEAALRQDAFSRALLNMDTPPVLDPAGTGAGGNGSGG